MRSIVLGIDVRLPELLLADRLRQEGRRVDAVIAHHAHGIGRSPSLSWDTMPFLVDLLALEGVPRADAEACIYPYIEGKLRDLEDFHRIGPDMARLLGLPLGCIHTPADYYITVGVRAAVEEARAETVGDVVRALHTLPRSLLPPAWGWGAGDERGRGPPRRAHPVQVRRGYILPPEAYPLLGAPGSTPCCRSAAARRRTPAPPKRRG